MLKIRRSRDRLIFHMGIPIPGKNGLYIETGPRCIIHGGITWGIFYSQPVTERHRHGDHLTYTIEICTNESCYTVRDIDPAQYLYTFQRMSQTQYRVSVNAENEMGSNASLTPETVVIPGEGEGKCHDDVIKWKHFPRYWQFVRGIHRSTVNSPHKGQWRGPVMFSLICVWMDGWVNNREAGDLRRYRVHCDVIVMRFVCIIIQPQ